MIVTAKIEVTFVIESVQLLNSVEAIQVKQSLLKLLHMAMHMYGRDHKRTVEWTDDFFPVMARKCKHMSRYPTDAPLPDC